MRLKKEHIVQKIRDNQTPYWLLFLDMGNGRRASSPSDFYDPESQGTGTSLDDKIEASIAKLENVLNTYEENLDDGETAVFYITMRRDKRSNGEAGKFEYTFVIGTSQGDSVSSMPAQYGDALGGFVSRSYVEQLQELNSLQTELKLKEFDLKHREDKLKERETELKELERKFNSQSEKYGKALEKAADKLLDGLIGDDDDASSSLSGFDENDTKAKAVEDLAEYVYDHTATETEVMVLKKIIVKTIDKLKAHGNLSEEKKEQPDEG